MGLGARTRRRSDRQRSAAYSAKVDAAEAQGATFIVIDTPPHADSAASRAVEAADLVGSLPPQRF
jgi:cellulose biosynthesis protein BcsQ